MFPNIRKALFFRRFPPHLSRLFFWEVQSVDEAEYGALINAPYSTLNGNINLNYIYRSSPYRAVNSLRLGYTNQSVNAV